MKSQLRAGLVLFILLTLLTGVIYPLLVTLVAQAAFPHQANGSVLEREGKPIGSALIGQQFDFEDERNPETRNKYFWGRPSAIGYNAASSSGSNLGPTNPALLDAVRDRVEAFRKAHPDQAGPVPVELVTTSASGLDPHISPAAAEYQVARVAQARGLSQDRVRQLVRVHTENRWLGLLGEPRINVLLLNLALEEQVQ